MNRDDIIRMARKAGYFLEPVTESDADCLELFFQAAYAAGAAAEREAIAQMIEDSPKLMKLAQNDQGGCLICGFTPKMAAKVIRARGNK